MRQFAKIMLSVSGLAGVAVALSSTRAQAAGSSVSFSANGLAAGVFFVDVSNPADTVFANVGVSQTANTGFMLFYSVTDSAGTFNDFGFGSIPTSSVNISGGSIDAGKVVFTLNVNTCDIANFTVSSGPCGSLNITWTEEPASITGSVEIRQNIVQRFPGGGKLTLNSETVSFSAVATGTVLNFSPAVSVVASLSRGTSVGVMTAP